MYQKWPNCKQTFQSFITPGKVLMVHLSQIWYWGFQIYVPSGIRQLHLMFFNIFQIWDSLQALFSSVSGTLAAHATFEGLGVGEQSASVSGATFVWMLKMRLVFPVVSSCLSLFSRCVAFSAGMIGSIVFAYYKSSSLDAHCKQWRLFADILNDISLALAIVSPLFPTSYFVLISCLSSLFHALVGVAGSTTRAALRLESAF